MKNVLSKIIIVCVGCALVAGCGRPFTAVAPEGFAAYKGGKHFRAVSPDHVVYRVRTLKNKPFADFKFWREALPERMKNAGYRIVADSVISKANENALLLELAAPVGQADYSYLVLMMVYKKKILIAEAAGVFGELQRRKKSVVEALMKITMS